MPTYSPSVLTPYCGLCDLWSMELIAMNIWFVNGCVIIHLTFKHHNRKQLCHYSINYVHGRKMQPSNCPTNMSNPSILKFELIMLHYEKLCSHKFQWHASRCSKQLMCNYVTTISWKYKELKIKMAC